MAERGKWAEGQVRDVLTGMEKQVAGFCFNRIPDARGGFLQPADADFQWFLNTGNACLVGKGPAASSVVDIRNYDMAWPSFTRNGVIEVKEVEHLTLLPHKNFSKDKIARVVRRQMAGCEAIVLVAHKLEGMRKPDVTWRSVPLHFFAETQYVKGVGSWDLSAFPLVDMEAVVRSIVAGVRG